MERPGDRSTRARLLGVCLAVLLALVVVFSLTTGASGINAVEVIAGWLRGEQMASRDAIIL